jgi:hypothetical protein
VATSVNPRLAAVAASLDVVAALVVAEAALAGAIWCSSKQGWLVFVKINTDSEELLTLAVAALTGVVWASKLAEAVVI